MGTGELLQREEQALTQLSRAPATAQSLCANPPWTSSRHFPVHPLVRCRGSRGCPGPPARWASLLQTLCCGSGPGLDLHQP